MKEKYIHTSLQFLSLIVIFQAKSSSEAVFQDASFDDDINGFASSMSPQPHSSVFSIGSSKKSQHGKLYCTAYLSTRLFQIPIDGVREKTSKQSRHAENNGALKKIKIEQLHKISKQKSIIDFLTSYLVVNFHKLDDDQFVPAYAHKLGHPASAFNKIQIPPTFFPIRHFQSADSQQIAGQIFGSINIFF